MKKWLVVFVFLFVFAPFSRAQFGSFGDVPIEINAEQTRFEGGIAIAEGNVIIQYADTTIYCDYAQYNPDTRDVLVRGNVRIYRAPKIVTTGTGGGAGSGGGGRQQSGQSTDGQLFVGERAVYNLETKELHAANFHGEFYPFKFSSETLSTLTGNSFQARDAIFTTSDSSKPDWEFRAKSVRIYPKDRIIFSDVTLYVGKLPVFWWPYLYQSLNRDTSFSLTPGYRSEWGAFLLYRQHFPIAENWDGILHLDLRSQRGVAIGLDSDYKYGKRDRSWGRFRAYYANDLTPPTITYSDSDTSSPVDPNRYRVSFQNRLYITDDIYANIDINKLSDPRFLQDFLPNEFRVDPQPDNVLSVTKLDDHYALSLIYRKQLNNFLDMTERLPELALDFTRQPLFGSPIFYQGETSVARLNRNFSRGALFEDYGATRVDTYHELLYPQVYGGWLSVIPRIGLRGTYYSETGHFQTDMQDETVEDILPDNTYTIRHVVTTTNKLSTGGAGFRGVADAGFEASFKFSRVWDDASSRLWGLDGLRHIVQPYTDFSFVRTNRGPDDILQFDRFQPSTQLPMFDFPQFTSIDAIDNWSILQLGVRNRLQTRRDNSTFNWLEMDTFFDVNLDEPEFPGANLHQGALSNLYNRLRWNPLPWFSFTVASQTPLNANGFTEINTGVSWLVNQDLRLDLSHRYLNENPFFTNSSLINLGAYYRLDDNWAISAREEYEAVGNLLENQVYEVHRDLSSWVASLGFIIRDSGTGSNEYGVLLTFTLKDFPAISLPISLDPQGEGISGKNK
jgi:LPS-assembly protein